MSELHEFGGPINRPAHNARQVTPGEALEGARPDGGGMDFLGLNEQLAPTVPSAPPVASAPAPAAQGESWLMEMRESSRSSLAPHSPVAAPEPAMPSATATSLLNASWREEPPTARRPRWLVPVAGGAALVVVGLVGLPKLRKPAPEPTTVTVGPSAAATVAPAAPSASDEPGDSSALALIEPVAPDPSLDRARPARAGRAGVAAGPEAGRHAAPVNAPPPGASFAPPRIELFDPSGAWQVETSEYDVDTTSEASSEAFSADDGGAPLPGTSAVESPSSTPDALLAQNEVGECEPSAERRFAEPTTGIVDWDRLVWIAKTSPPSKLAKPAGPGVPRGGTEPEPSAAARSDSAPATDEGIARALAAWSGIADLSTPRASSAPSDDGASEASDSTAKLVVEATPTVAAQQEPSPVPTAADELNDVAADATSDVAVVGELSSEPAAELEPALARGESTTEVGAVPTEAESSVAIEGTQASTSDAAREPAAEDVALSGAEASSDASAESSAESSAAPLVEIDAEAGAEPRVRVVARGGGRAGERGEAALRRERRQARLAASEKLAASSTPLAAVNDPPSDDLQAPTPASAAGAQGADVAGGVVSVPSQPASPELELPAPGAPSLARVEEPQSSTRAPSATDESRAPAARSEPPSSEVATSTRVQPDDAVAEGTSSTAGTPVTTNGATSKVASSQRVLRSASDDDLQNVHRGASIPLDEAQSKVRIVTPEVGKVRVTFHTGDIFEGDLVAVGEGQVWLRSKHGTLGLDATRVKSAVRIAPGQGPALGAAGSQKLAGLPRARVKTPGGTLYGKVVEHDEVRTTLVLDSGARVVLDSRTVELLGDQPSVQIRP